MTTQRTSPANVAGLVDKWRGEAARHRAAQMECDIGDHDWFLHERELNCLDRCAMELSMTLRAPAQRMPEPEMLAALKNVQKIISDAAMTGFNYKDGDWAERLFQSQQVTSAAIKNATALSSTSRCAPIGGHETTAFDAEVQAAITSNNGGGTNAE